jgi:hypothetical protein
MVVPDPELVIAPGFLVRVQVPDAGNPFITTLPVAKAHVGCVIDPGTGAPGIPATALITILEEEGEVQPPLFATVHVYVPVASPEMVVVAPDPVVTIPPGLLVNVQFPAAGSPLKTTLPVGKAQVGCVILAPTGAAGTGDTVAMTADLVPVVQPLAVASA